MLKGIKCDVRKENVPFNECLMCKRCNNFPLILKKRLLKNEEVSKEQNISVTRIIDCSKKVYLQMTTDYYFDKYAIISMGLGTMIHKEFEDVFDIPERYVDYETPDGVKVIGYVDGIDILSRTLYDIKTVAQGKYKLNLEMEQDRDSLQIQILWTMLKQKGIDIRHGKIVYIGLGDKLAHERVVPFIDQTDFINKRVLLLQKALEEKKCPEFDPQRNWECKICEFTECEKNQKNKNKN